MLKSNLIALCLILCCSCKNNNPSYSKPLEEKKAQQIVHSGFQSLLDSAGVKGSILVYDSNNNIYYSNDFQWASRGNLPASTFKIANSIIGLETGIIESDSTKFLWDGEEKYLDAWEQDLILKDAFQFSCVPCYQEVARNIGAYEMNAYVEKLAYGKLVIDFSNIDVFWLQGKSKINQMEQIDFLRRLHNSQLPISARTERIVKEIMISEEKENYTLRGKTGLSIEDEKHNGWYVGYAETDNNVFFFATNLEPITTADVNSLINKRVVLTKNALGNFMGASPLPES